MFCYLACCVRKGLWNFYCLLKRLAFLPFLRLAAAVLQADQRGTVLDWGQGRSTRKRAIGVSFRSPSSNIIQYKLLTTKAIQRQKIAISVKAVAYFLQIRKFWDSRNYNASHPVSQCT